MNAKEYHFQNTYMIPRLLEVTSETLEGSKEQLINLSAAKEKPYVLDDEIISRSENLYKAQVEDAEFYLAQVKYWKGCKLTEEEWRRIHEIEDKTNELIKANKEILDILQYCKKYTIDKILAKDDMELAIDVLSGKIPSPK